MVIPRKETHITSLEITVKIYLFCPDTGLYQGEDFADDSSMKGERTDLPAGATTIAPPPFERGTVPIFCASENRWNVSEAASLAETAAAPEKSPR